MKVREGETAEMFAVTRFENCCYPVNFPKYTTYKDIQKQKICQLVWVGVKCGFLL